MKIPDIYIIYSKLTYPIDSKKKKIVLLVIMPTVYPKA